MKNENSDEKVTSMNSVNQSQRAYCIQLAEPVHKATWLQLLLLLIQRGATLNWRELFAKTTKPEELKLSYPVNTSHFGLVSTYKTTGIDAES